jgi:toxin HigB-1
MLRRSGSRHVRAHAPCTTYLHGYRVSISLLEMIASFGDRATEDLFHGRRSARVWRYPPGVFEAAVIKLDLLNAAAALQDLRSPPGNRLKMLKGEMRGWYSMRVNDQWRLVFRWNDGDAYSVRLTDYH